MCGAEHRDSGSGVSVDFDRLIDRLRGLDPIQLGKVDRLVSELESADPRRKAIQGRYEPLPQAHDWPHAPVHRLRGKGTFIVTASALHKDHFFRDADRLDLLQRELLAKANRYQWHLEAWAVFSNHYHFVGQAREDARSLKAYLTHLHADTAREINRWDGVTDRQVWFNFWDTELTFERSYLARLNYVHQNPVRHGLVPVPNQYPRCSARWFERTATPAQVKTIYGFKTDRVKVVDNFEVLGVR
jgi:putative transposase